MGHAAGPILAGAERSLLDILAAIDRRKYDVTCVLPADDAFYMREVRRHTSSIEVLPYRWWNGRAEGDPHAVGQFAKLFRRLDISLVHANTITLLDPLLAARMVGIPSILHARELIHDDAALAAELHCDADNVVRSVRANADFIIANSDATHRVFRKKRRSFRLYNCIDTDAFDVPNEIGADALTVGIISANHPKKGVEYIVRLAQAAARQRLDVEFLVIGPDTDYTAVLMRMVADADTPARIRFVGYIDSPLDAIRALNVLVSFSVVPESFGRTIVEAMAARRPVIAFEGGAVSELVRHGRDGFVIPQRDLASALKYLRLLAEDRGRVAKMGRTARARTELLFSRRVFAAGLNRIYGYALPSGEGRGPILHRIFDAYKELRVRWSP